MKCNPEIASKFNNLTSISIQGYLYSPFFYDTIVAALQEIKFLQYMYSLQENSK